MCQTAERIKTNLLLTPEIDQRDLAGYLNISEKTLSYQLNYAKQVREDIRKGADKFFKINGIEILLDDSKECSALLKAVGHLLKDGSIDIDLDQFYEEVLQAIDDNVLTESEKCKLVTVVERLRIANRTHNENRMRKIEKDMDQITNLLNYGRV